MLEHASDDDIHYHIEKVQGELGAIEADDEALAWDDVEEEGLAPPCGEGRLHTHGTGYGGAMRHAHPRQGLVPGMRGRQIRKCSP